MHDPDARPIRKGRLGRPVELGYKAQLVDNEDGVILDHNIERGNPADAPMLVPAVERIARRAGCMPKAVTADRGYGETALEDQLRGLGVRNGVLARKGKANAERAMIQNRRSFKRMVRRRTGCEGRISCAKRDFGIARTRIDGLPAPEPGAGTASSTTTSSRSQGCSNDDPPTRQGPPDDSAESRMPNRDSRPTTPNNQFFRSK